MNTKKGSKLYAQINNKICICICNQKGLNMQIFYDKIYI